MVRFFNRLRELLHRPPPIADNSPETAFTSKYRSFRSLLAANNSALETMAEMEQTLISGQVFGMTFVRAATTGLMVSVYKMVQNLQTMTDGKYPALEQRFTAIREQINPLLEEQQPLHEEGPWIMALEAIDRWAADRVGTKMANLGEVANGLQLPTPPGFAITAAAGRHFLARSGLTEEIHRRLQLLDADDLESLYKTSAALQQLIARAPLPPALEEAILAGYDRLIPGSESGATVAMRSSAIGEDTGRASFAGQYRTELHVSREFLGQAYKEIVASKYSSQAIIYRLRKGYRDKDVAMGVGCLAMVSAVVSGVMYSRDPRHPRSHWVVINSVRGLPKSLVDGTQTGDLYLASREPPHPVLRRRLQVVSPEAPLQALTAENTASGDLRPMLAEHQIQALTRMAIGLENHFGLPQDIEWAIDDGDRIVILQSRPIVEEGQALPAADNLGEPAAGTSSLLAGGVTASPGVACGPAFIVQSNVDLLQFPKGAVLVTVHPLPQWTPLLSRAVALVAESGSLAGHLATVAREFGRSEERRVGKECRSRWSPYH